MSDVKYGLVIYTDGGARPQNGPAGWGMHGYLYASTAPKKGAGHSTHFPSATGYVPKSQPDPVPDPVTPLYYVDGCGAFPEFASNNVAELQAVLATLEIALRFGQGNEQHHSQGHYQSTPPEIDPKKATFETYTQCRLSSVRIYSDSKYVVDGLMKQAPGWKQRGWLKADGQPPKNLDLWIRIDEITTLLRSSGTEVILEWVKAHTDESDTIPVIIGNVIADQLATIGVYHAKHRQTLGEIDYSPAEGYWKSEIERHVFLNLPILYFSDAYSGGADTYFLASRNKSTPDKNVKANDAKAEKAKVMLDPDAAYALVVLKDHDPVVKTVVDYHRECLDNENTLSVMYLDDVYQATQYRYILKYGRFSMENTGQYKTELTSSLDRFLTSEMNPPGNAYRTIEISTALSKYLGELDPARYTTTDLTDLFYDRETKKSVERRVLKPTFKVGMSTFKVIAGYHLPDDHTVTRHETELILRLGVDLPDRNTLKRMESLNPTITLVTFTEDKTQLRYVVRIDTEQASGVWVAWYSNLKMIR